QRLARLPPRGPPPRGPPPLPERRDVPPVLHDGHGAPADPRERHDGGPAPCPEGDSGDARDHPEGTLPLPRPATIHPRVPDRPSYRDGVRRGREAGTEGPLLGAEGRDVAAARSKSRGLHVGPWRRLATC